MKKRVLLSVCIGLLFAALSLLHKVGTGPEPMPYMGGGYGIANGIVINEPLSTPSAPTLTQRGWPLAIASIAPENDEPGELYKSLIVKNLLINVALYSIVVFGALSIMSAMKKDKQHEKAG